MTIKSPIIFKWGSSWSLAQLEPLSLLFSYEARAEVQLSSSLYYYYFQMRLELKFSSARASIIIILKWGLTWSAAQLSSSLYYYYHYNIFGWGSSWSSTQLKPLLSNLMTRLTAGQVGNYDQLTHLSTFRRRIYMDKKYWEGTCPSNIFLADIKNIRI